MSRSRRTLVTVFGGTAVLMLGGSLLLLVLARPSNCGGNSAALAACKSIGVCFRIIAAERGTAVAVAELTPQEREYFEQVAGLSWLKESRVLVSPARLGTDGETGRVIIAVCDTAFSNVPRRRFGKAPLTHAVGYDDGSVGLISAEEFRRVDLRGFVDVRTIAKRNVEPDGGFD